MAKIFDIFSFSNKDDSERKKPKEKVIVDYREKNSLIAAKLMKLGLDVEFQHLRVGDYIVKDVIIERKTVSDFVSSMINKRLLRQIESLKQYENRLLIIEGSENFLDEIENNFSIHPNAIKGFLLSITLKHKTPIIFTRNPEDTASFIDLIARKKEKEISLNHSKKPLNKKEQMQFILEAFPGIGPKTAKKLLKEFKTLKKIFNSSLEELRKVIGKKAENIYKLINEN